MENANPVKNPLDPKITLKPNSEGKNGDHSNTFACLIGSLQYFSTATCPDTDNGGVNALDYTSRLERECCRTSQE